MRKLFLFLIFLLIAASSVQAQFDEEGPIDTRVRFTYHVLNGPAVDIYVNGNIVAQAITYPQISDYAVVNVTDHYTIAVALTGDEESEPLLVLEEQTLTPEHDTLIALLGSESTAISPIIIDETAIKTNPEATQFIVLNANPNSQGMAASLNQQPTTDTLTFGDYATFALTVPNADIDISIDGQSFSAVTTATQLIPGTLGLIIAIDSPEQNLQTIFTYQGNLDDFIMAISPTLIPQVMFSGFPGLMVPQDEPTTFFLPNMAALASLPADALEGGSGHAAFFFLHHTLQGIGDLHQLVGAKSIQTMHGAELTISGDNNTLVFNDALSISPEALPISFGNIDVYVVDAVLLPPQASLEVIDGGVINIGDTVAGNLEERTRIRYLLDVPANTPINIYLRDDSGEFDAHLRIYDTQGQIVIENDDFNGPNSAIEQWSVEEDTQIIIEIGSFADSVASPYILEVIAP